MYLHLRELRFCTANIIGDQLDNHEMEINLCGFFKVDFLVFFGIFYFSYVRINYKISKG